MHCHIMFNKGAMAVYMFFRGANSIEGTKKKFVANPNEIAVSFFVFL
jgi:hypothetical protein